MQKYPWAKPTPPVNPSEWVLVWMCNNNLFLFVCFYNVTEIKYTKTNAKLHRKCHCGTEILFISICMWPSLILPQKHHSFSFLRNLKERESMGFMCADRPWGKVFCTFAHLHTWRSKSKSKSLTVLFEPHIFFKKSIQKERYSWRKKIERKGGVWTYLYVTCPTTTGKSFVLCAV